MATEKFKTMVHQIVASAPDPQRLGATRLNKICWYADTLAYGLWGKSITGETYVKRERGPVPKAILPTLRELEHAGAIGVRDHQYLPGRKIRLFVAMQDADVSGFTADELDILKYVTDFVCDHTASEISELSHDAIWDAANDGEEIPMCATLVARPAQMNEKIKAWAEKMVEKVAEQPAAA
jgi:hypothetical protein